LSHLPREIRITRGPRDLVSYRRAKWSSGDGLQRVQFRELPEPVYLRPNTTDAQVAWDTLIRRFHVPPFVPTSILDLGSNIGLTLAHYRALYPQARLVGVEMDSDNAEMAGLNAPGITLHRAAVWTHRGEINYDIERGEEWGAAVSPHGSKLAVATPIAELVAEGYDFVKMDVEGTESELLKAPGWAERVRCIKVEVHAPYTMDGAVADLQALAFEQVTKTPDGHHVLAIR
jgi:FkbM family methyltransferase